MVIFTVNSSVFFSTIKKSLNSKKIIAMQMFLRLNYEHEGFLFAIEHFSYEEITHREQRFDWKMHCSEIVNYLC